MRRLSLVLRIAATCALLPVCVLAAERYDGFASPDNASAAHHAFSGKLRFDGAVAARLQVHADVFGILPDAASFRLPPLNAKLVAWDGLLLPEQRTPMANAASTWEFILLPGRTWREPGARFDRGALPFALFEKNANCLHYGVMAFDYDAERLRSPLLWQIAGETCAYLKFDASGTEQARYEPGPVAGADGIVADYRAERAARLPRVPLDTLPAHYAAAMPAAFAHESEVPRADLTAFGFVIDGTHFAGPCVTRAGPYPYCDELPLPSYSLAKSLVAGLGLMRAEQASSGIRQALISDFVPECQGTAWRGVTFEHALDMATGNYEDSAYEADEHGLFDSAFFTAADHATKIRVACNRFPRRAAPGERWVYHTTDTYVLGTALANWLQKQHGPSADLYEWLVAEPLWKPLQLSPLTGVTRRTADDRHQPFTGWGLALLADDVARVASFLAGSDGRIADRQVLDSPMLAAALQRRADDRGLSTGVPGLRYNNGFWAYDAGPSLGCREPAWVPVMSGYGGIIVALFPNDTVYYYFSDGGTHRWLKAAAASHRLRPFCNTDTAGTTE